VDYTRLGKIVRSAAEERAKRPLGSTARETSKEELRRMAEEALKSGVKIQKLPPAKPERLK
jgi:hypothetical protein